MLSSSFMFSLQCHHGDRNGEIQELPAEMFSARVPAQLRARRAKRGSCWPEVLPAPTVATHSSPGCSLGAALGHKGHEHRAAGMELPATDTHGTDSIPLGTVDVAPAAQRQAGGIVIRGLHPFLHHIPALSPPVSISSISSEDLSPPALWGHELSLLPPDPAARGSCNAFGAKWWTELLPLLPGSGSPERGSSARNWPGGCLVLLYIDLW